MAVNDAEFQEYLIQRKTDIAEKFNGDEGAYEIDLRSGNDEAVSWHEIEDSLKILPDLEKRGHKLITALLGFLPEYYHRIEHEPFIRAVISSRDMNIITDQEFYEQAEQCIIPIRNKWLADPNGAKEYSKHIYSLYDGLTPSQKQRIRNRLTGFLGYEPDLATSVNVEVSLNKILFNDQHIWPEHITPADLQAILIIKYREILLSEGKFAADLSSLPVEQIKMLQNVLKTNF